MKEERQLRLVEEHKLHELLGRKASARLEASGVCVRGRYLYVIFDNSTHVARIERGIAPEDRRHAMLRERAKSIGFEDVTFHERENRFLLVLEAVPYPKKGGGYRPVIEEYDEDFRFVGDAWVDFALERENKGIEGLSYLRRDGVDYVLGLCESGRERARLQLFRKKADRWKHAGTLDLPRSIRFADYSSVSIDGDRIAIASQQSSALWVGRLAKKRLAVEGKGTTYLFPRSARGKKRYCTIEGVAWMSPKRVVAVSDRCKRRKQAARCCKRDQSIHVFELPD